MDGQQHGGAREAFTERNVETEQPEKYRKCGNFELHRGGLYARRSQTALELERWLDREMHAVFVRAPIASEGISDTRRKRQHSWRVHARRIRELVFAGTDDAVLNDLPQVWARFIERCRDAARRRRGIPVPPRRSGEFPRAA